MEKSTKKSRSSKKKLPKIPKY